MLLEKGGGLKYTSFCINGHHSCDSNRYDSSGCGRILRGVAVAPVVRGLLPAVSRGKSNSLIGKVKILGVCLSR